MLRWLCGLTLLASSGAIAQTISASPYAGLATPYDGSIVYFASTLRIKGTSQPLHGKLFEADEQGVRLFQSREMIEPPPPANPLQCSLGSYYEFYGAETTADGLTVAAPMNQSSAGDCTRLIKPATAIITRSGERGVTGIVRLSPNGPYALVYTASRFSSPTVSYLDLRTGVITPIALPLTYGIGGVTLPGRMIADDGTALYAGFILKPGTDPQPLDVEQDAYDFSIDGAASHVLYSTIVQAPGTYIGEIQLNILDLTTHQKHLIAKGNISLEMMSDDGLQMLYIQDGQVYIARTDGTGVRALSNDPDTITTATLSGNGRVVYAATGMGHLIRINAGTGEQTEIIGRTPFLSRFKMYGDAGMVATVTGTGLSQMQLQGTPPLNPWLGTLTMWMGERKVPVFELSPSEVRFIVPWDMSSAETPILAEVKGEHSPFDFPQSSITVMTEARAGVVMHQNWDGFVTGVSTGFTPAHLGEIVHVFAVGLGAVNPEVLPGSVAPSAEPLARLASPLICNDSDVLYAGLAPGNLERVYQVDLRLNATGYHKFDCTSGGKASLALSLTLVP